MLKEKWLKVKENIGKQQEGGQSKKKIENLVVFVIILIVTLFLINSIWNEDDKKDKNVQNEKGKVLAQEEQVDISVKENSKNELEQRLENILEKIEGVGEVNVLITYSETSKKIALYNEDYTKSDTEEKDTNGGNRKITESSNKKEVVFEEVDGEKQPVTQSIVTPTPEGAIITARGASDSSVKANIVQAVEAVTGLATHKIQVFEMKK